MLDCSLRKVLRRLWNFGRFSFRRSRRILILTPGGLWFLPKVFHELLHVLRAQFGQLESSERRNDVILREIAVNALLFFPYIGRTDRIQPCVQEIRNRLPFGFGWQTLRQSGSSVH